MYRIRKGGAYLTIDLLDAVVDPKFVSFTIGSDGLTGIPAHRDLVRGESAEIGSNSPGDFQHRGQALSTRSWGLRVPAR